MKTIQAFVTEMTRVIRNTDFDDPVKFAAFRLIAEERIQEYANAYAYQKTEELRKELDDVKTNHYQQLSDQLVEDIERANETIESLRKENEELKAGREGFIKCMDSRLQIIDEQAETIDRLRELLVRFEKLFHRPSSSVDQETGLFSQTQTTPFRH